MPISLESVARRTVLRRKLASVFNAWYDCWVFRLRQVWSRRLRRQLLQRQRRRNRAALWHLFELWAFEASIRRLLIVGRNAYANRR